VYRHGGALLCGVGFALSNLWERTKQALRAYRVPPISLKDPALNRQLNDGHYTTTSGVVVSEQTALTFSPFWAGVNLISSTLGSLPLKLYKRTANKGKEEYFDAKTYQLLHDEPNPEMGAMVFRQTLQAHILTWGNAYAEIERDGAGRPSALWPIPPNRVRPYRNKSLALRYEIHNEDGTATELNARDMLHVPGLGFDGNVGYSVVAMARRSLGMGIAMEEFGSSFYGNGSWFGGFIETPARVSPEARQFLRESLEKRHQGASKAYRLGWLTEGLKFVAGGAVPPRDAQFLEGRTFQINDVARWLNMPPHKLRELTNATFSNIEEQNIEWVTDSIRPWCVLWEQELNRKLIPRLERRIQFFEHNVEGLLRGNIESRYNAYAIGRTHGWLSADDVRQKENMNPLPDGQGGIYLLQGNMVPANRINEIIDKQVAPDPAPVAPQPAPPTDNGEADDRAARMAAELRAEMATLGERQAEAVARAEAADAALLDTMTGREALQQKADEALREAYELGQQKATLAARLLVTEEHLAHERTAREAAEAERVLFAQSQSDAATRAEIAEQQAKAEAEARAAAEAQIESAILAASLAQSERDEAAKSAAAADVQRLAFAQSEAEARTRADLSEQQAAAATAAREQAEAAMATAQATAGVALSELDEAVRARGEAEIALQARVAALDEAMEAQRALEADYAGRFAEASTVTAAEIAAREAAEAELDEQRAEVARLALELSSAQARATDTKSAASVIETELKAATEALTGLTAERDALLRTEADLRLQVVAEQEAALTIQRRAQEERAALEASLLAERDGLKKIIAEADAIVVADQAEAARVRALAESRALEIDALVDAKARAEEMAREYAGAMTARRGALINSHRELYVDIMARMIDRESDRLVAAQATREKLRSVIGPFYERHEGVVKAALLPAVRIHLTFVNDGRSAEEMAADLAAQHCAASRAALADVFDADGDEYHTVLARLLNNWRNDRVSQIANYLIAMEIDHAA
jgi:HK97 family phage portal protein